MHKLLPNRLVMIVVFIIILLLLIFASIHYDVKNYFSLAGLHRYNLQIIDYTKNNLLWSLLIYWLVYCGFIIFSLPGRYILNILAGFIYGIGIGIAMIIFGYISGSILNYLMIKYLFSSDFADKLMLKYQHVIKKIDLSKKFTLLNLVGLRIIPIVPFWLLNMLSVAGRMKFSVFLGTLFLGVLPAAIIYAVLGAQFRIHLDLHDLSAAMTPQLKLILCLIALVILLPNILWLILQLKAYRHKKHSGE